MTAFVIARPRPEQDGPQPFDPGRHMRQVARLVGVVFADELDARGRKSLREMELAGRLAPFLGDLVSLTLFNDALYGQVWVEGGQVIGNVTLQPGDQSGSRWRVSNVAVAPEHRGRGIARALMQATIREVAEREGSWTLLQVRADNAAAHGLYRSLGFEDVSHDSVWRLPAPPAPPPAPDPGVTLAPLRSLTGSEWLELARAARSPLAQWAEPIDRGDYESGFQRLLGEALGRLTGFYRAERWAVWDGRSLAGAVETRMTPLLEHDTLRFAVRPSARGRLEAALVARGLRSLAGNGRRPIVVAHDHDHAEGVAALETAGFRVERSLITMRRAVKAADARR